MTDAALHAHAGAGTIGVRPSLDRASEPRTLIIFLGLLGAGLLFVAYSLYADVDASGTRTTTFLPYLLLFVALLIALGFEFVTAFTTLRMPWPQ
jgi:PiT family inorganic phosphate transporter